MRLQSKNRNIGGDSCCFWRAFHSRNTLDDYDHSANFGQYKTYSWEKVKTKDQLLVDRIKSAVNSALAAKAGGSSLGRR